MLEGLTTLGYMAAHSRRARLGLLVGGIHYRTAGLWIKAATTLDVLSGGRAYFGIGAAWNEQESRAWGFPMPPLGERFEMLEETLQLAHAAWTGEQGARERFDGRHYQASDPLNAPQALSHPQPPILIGGGGERRTLKFVAHYADACNIFGTDPGPAPAQVRRAAAPLRERRARLRRDREVVPHRGLHHPRRRSALAHARRHGGAPRPHRGGRGQPPRSWAFATWRTFPSSSSSVARSSRSCT